MTAIPATVLWWRIKFYSDSVRHTPPVSFYSQVNWMFRGAGGLIIHAPSTCLQAHYIININACQYFVPKKLYYFSEEDISRSLHSLEQQAIP